MVNDGVEESLYLHDLPKSICKIHEKIKLSLFNKLLLTKLVKIK